MIQAALEGLWNSDPERNSRGNFFLVAGPCVTESTELCLEVASRVKDVCERLHIPYVFKASYRKANRSSLRSYTGPGDEAGLQSLSEVRRQLSLPVLTDIHEADEAALAAEVADVIQIPAFLCRQTELLQAAGATGKGVNIKKGQFSSAGSMQFAIEKVSATGNQKIWLTERGNSFGYQDLVVDFRNIHDMQQLKVPVLMDVTHSLQIPNQSAGVTGGRPELIPLIAKASVAAGADGLFIETHPNPSKALSDGANMLPLHDLSQLLEVLVRIRRAALGA
ncbi:MAG: 3-deoxy-8-phosphooctulonate synthase [Sphingomonadales bacterium]|nr:3-deoxy-8-phosphooctulonate synthase [Sphingomonadales bacterium]